MRLHLLLSTLVCTALMAAEPPRLGSSNLPAGRIEDVLPPGATVHIRFAHPANTLNQIDALARQFIPENVLPPEDRARLAQPHGLLALVGQHSVGAPIDSALISRLTGLDARRSAAWTLYASMGGAEWVLSLPASDFQALSGMLINLTRARSFVQGKTGSRVSWTITGANPDLPLTLVIVCSSDTAYICSSDRLAAQLGAGPQLSADPVVRDAPADADVVICLSTAAVKPLVALFGKQFAKLPPPMVAGLRAQALRAMGPSAINSLNLQLRLHLGLAGVQEAFDYAECMLTAATETFVPILARHLAGVDGATLSVKLSPEGVRVGVVLQAAGIEAMALKLLPLPEVTQALAALPGQRLWFSAIGNEPADPPGSVRGDWAELTARKLASKGITSPYWSALAGYWKAEERAPTLGNVSPWVLTTSVDALAITPKGPTLADWVDAVQSSIPLPDLVVVPRQKADVVSATFAGMAAVENRNAARWTAALVNSIGDSRWIDTSARFRSEARPGKADRLIYEDVWTTRSGVFGYSQHELVNRIIAYTTQRGSLQLLQRVEGDHACWLDDAPVAGKPLAPAITGLLAQVPAGADRIWVARLLPAVGPILDGMASLEGAVRHDFDAYLTACTAAIAAHPGDQARIMEALQRIPMPYLTASLNIDITTRNLYLVLPGQLRYPRPNVGPVLRQLVAPFLAQVDADGGMVAWTSSTPGHATAAAFVDVRSFARFIRLTGNATHSMFFAAGDPMATLRTVLGHPADGDDNPQDEVIIYNTMWQ